MESWTQTTYEPLGIRVEWFYRDRIGQRVKYQEMWCPYTTGGINFPGEIRLI